MLTQSIIEKEFALSGSEQNPDITGKDLKLTAERAAGRAPRVRSRRSSSTASDFVVADNLRELVAG